MASPVSVDTPDYQRGVVSAQKLLATVPGGTTAATVGLPPNVETLVVIVPGFDLTSATCVGTTSNATYPGIATRTGQGAGFTTSLYFDVSAAIDASVTVTAGGAPNKTWYIYGDSGVHITTDLGLDTTLVGAGYRGLSAVGTTALDPNVQNASPLPVVATETTGDVVLVSNATQLIAAPSVGANYIFGWSCQNNSTDSGQAACVLWAGTKTIDYLGIPGGDGNASDAHSFGHPFRTVEAVLFGIYGPATPVGRAILLYAPGP